MNPIPVDPRTDKRWQRLSESPAGSLFTSPPWLRALCSTYDFVPRARIALDAAGEPTAGFAWVNVDDLRGARSISLPFSDRAEPVASSTAAWRSVARECIDSETPLIVRCFDDSPVAGAAEMVRCGVAAWHGTPLGASLDELMERISGQNRRNIRIARRNGVRVVTSSDGWAVREFHRLHVALRKRKYRLLAQPLDLLDQLRKQFDEHGGFLTFLAYLDEEPIAGAVYLVWNDVMYQKYAASKLDTLRLRANQAVAATALEWGVTHGMRLLDWGLSDLDQPGLVEYKRGWAPVEKRIVTWRSKHAVASSTEASRLLHRLTGVLTDEDVPDVITARAGALLYRYFC